MSNMARKPHDGQSGMSADRDAVCQLALTAGACLAVVDG
jgi:hypothetical protein